MGSCICLQYMLLCKEFILNFVSHSGSNDRDASNVKTSFWWWSYRSSKLWSVSGISKMAEHLLRMTKTFNWYHWHKHCQSLYKNMWCLLANNLWCLWIYLGLSYGTCQQILLEELGMCCIATKFVHHLLTIVQKTLFMCAESSKNVLKMTEILFHRSLLMIEHEFMGMSQKQNSSHHWNSPSSSRQKNVF